MTHYLNLSGGYFAEHQILMIVLPSALPKSASHPNALVQNTARVVILIGFAVSHGFMQVNMLTRYLL